MNKKTLIALIAVPLVILVIVGILGARYFFKPKDISVTGVEFTVNGQPVTDDNYTIQLDTTNGEAQQQLTWKITPENATNKKVTFTSSSNQITVTEEGLIKSSAVNTGAVITIKTEDGNKTDTINVEAKSSAAQILNYDFTTNKITTTSTEFDYNDETDTYVFYKDMNYSFVETSDSNVLFTLPNTNELVYNQTTGAYNASNIGEFEITITPEEGEAKTLKCEVLRKITILELPTHLTEAQTAGVEYKIGSQNTYTFNYITNADVLAKQLQSKVYLAEGGGAALAGTALSDVVTITDTNKFAFKPAAVGNKYTIEISSIANADKKISYTFNVIDAWNVSNHDELKAAYNEGANQKSSIVLVNNIEVNADECFQLTQDGTQYQRTGTAEHEHNGRIYVRYADLTLEGNGHTVSAEKAKLFTRYNVGNAATGEQSFCHDGNPAVFQVAKIVNNRNITRDNKDFYYSPELKEHLQGIGDDPTYTNSAAYVETQKAYLEAFYAGTGSFVPPVVTFKNVNIVANSGYNIADTTDPSNPEYLGFRTLSGIKASGAKIVVDGCNISKVLDGVTSIRSASLTVKNSTIDNVGAFCVYTLRSRDLVLEDSTFGHAGHTAVLPQCMDSGYMIDGFIYFDGVEEYYNATDSGTNLAGAVGAGYFDQAGAPTAKIADVASNGPTIELKGNVVFNNWLDINDSYFFQADTSSYQAAQLLRQSIVQMLGDDMGLVLKARDGETFNGSNFDILTMNYAIQLESAISQSKRVNFTRVVNNLTNANADFDNAAIHKKVINAEKGPLYGATYSGREGIKKATLDYDASNSSRTLMDLGLNMSALKKMGNSYLSQFILGINEAMQQG